MNVATKKEGDEGGKVAGDEVRAEFEALFYYLTQRFGGMDRRNFCWEIYRAASAPRAAEAYWMIEAKSSKYGGSFTGEWLAYNGFQGRRGEHDVRWQWTRDPQAAMHFRRVKDAHDMVAILGLTHPDLLTERHAGISEHMDYTHPPHGIETQELQKRLDRAKPDDNNFAAVRCWNIADDAVAALREHAAVPQAQAPAEVVAGREELALEIRRALGRRDDIFKPVVQLVRELAEASPQAAAQP